MCVRDDADVVNLRVFVGVRPAKRLPPARRRSRAAVGQLDLAGSARSNVAAVLPMRPPSTSGSAPVTVTIASNRWLRGRGFFAAVRWILLGVGFSIAAVGSTVDPTTGTGEGKGRRFRGLLGLCSALLRNNGLLLNQYFAPWFVPLLGAEQSPRRRPPRPSARLSVAEVSLRDRDPGGAAPGPTRRPRRGCRCGATWPRCTWPRTRSRESTLPSPTSGRSCSLKNVTASVYPARVLGHGDHRPGASTPWGRKFVGDALLRQQPDVPAREERRARLELADHGSAPVRRQCDRDLAPRRVQCGRRSDDPERE